MLLSREAFREGVFARDSFKCVLCGAPAQDAHHILERRLFSDGGYYLDNGASVCGPCHIKCEETTVSVEDIRHAAGITKIVVPEHFYHDTQYDKWGNVLLPNGMRSKGELFSDESVQKILAQGGVLHLFTDYVKYPRTYHLPWSNPSSDDRTAPSLDVFQGREVVVTVKMDGENSSLYSNYIHARSVDSVSHPSRTWLKTFHAKFAHDIPEGWRVCGENLYAKHSIHYTDLPTYFMGFSIWNERNECLSWDETLEWFELLGIEPVPTLYRGVFDEEEIKSLWTQKDYDSMEGYVVRLADKFGYGSFKNSVMKFVRPAHVQTVKHWMHGQKIEPNKLRD